MNMREINFSFAGLHCLRDFGCIYIEKGGHTISPDAEHNVYEIAGTSGTLRMPGVVHGTQTFEGALYFVQDPPDQQTAQANLRRIAKWLMNGRQRLIFDYEPQRYYMAQINESCQWNYAGWMGGGLNIAFEAQPYAYNVQANTASVATALGSASLAIAADTGMDAPLKISIENTGTAPISGVAVTVAGKSAVLEGMALLSGEALTIDMEPPIGATITGVGSSAPGRSAMPHATRFDHITLAAGNNAISAELTYGSGAAGARLTASVRGRYL